MLSHPLSVARSRAQPAPPAAIRPTEEAAKQSPAILSGVSRSPSSTRASRIVTAGYRDVITAVMASSPWWVARKNIEVPVAPITPVSRLSRRVPAGGRPRSRVAAATHATVTVAVTWEMTMGHRSVPDPARSRPMKNSPNPAPAARPSPTPAAWRCWPGAAWLVEADTPTIAGSARQMPISESEPGRSPSASPASTENVAVPTALIELATLNAAYRNPRYSANAPATPLAPAPAPQSADASDGAWLLMNGITQISRTVLVTSTSTVTRTTLALRAASPAAKSDPPYPAAAASASKTATIDQVGPGLRAGLARRSRFWEHRLGQCRLVSERDRQLARRRGVERRRRAQALYIRLRGAQFVPGEIGLRRGEPELGRPLGQHLVQRVQPGGQRLQVRRRQPLLAQAPRQGAERVVVAVDDHLGVAGHRRRPVQVVGADADDDHRRLRGPFRLGQLRRQSCPVVVLRPEQSVADGGAVAGEVEHPPPVDVGQVRRVGVGAAPAVTGVAGQPRRGREPGSRGGRVADDYGLDPAQRPARRVDPRRAGLAAYQLVERVHLPQLGRRGIRGGHDGTHVEGLGYQQPGGQ